MTITSWAALLGLLVSLAAPVICIPWLRRLGAVDVPNARSSHTVPTVRGAGLAPAAGTAAALLLVLGVQPQASLPILVFGGGLLAAALGFAEDIRGLPVQLRLTVQLMLGTGFGFVACLLAAAPLWLTPLIAVAMAAYINAANFMDGIDGVSALHGLAVGLHFVVLGVALDQAWLGLCGAVLAAVFLGFTPWNLLPGRVFLGDVGSYLLGALVAGSAVGAYLVGSGFLLAIAPALPYLADTFATAVVRTVRRERLSVAHRSHVYQRLTGLGLSHVGSAGVITVATVLCSAAAFFARLGAWQATSAAAVIVAVLGGYLSLPRVLRASLRQITPA